jgi:putative ABC transport system substrate-binding protein
VLAQAQAAAAPLGWEIVVAGYGSREEVLPALDIAKSSGADAVLVAPDPIALAQARAVVAHADLLRLPTLFFNQDDLEKGALFVLGPDRSHMWREAGGYVDRLLRGAMVAELPFVEPSRLFFGINVRTAKALGLTIPPTLLARADEVIE